MWLSFSRSFKIHSLLMKILIDNPFSIAHFFFLRMIIEHLYENKLLFFFKVTSKSNSTSRIFAGVTICKILFSFTPIFQCHNLSELLLIASNLSENKILTVCFVIFHSILFFPLCYSVSGNCDISYHKKHSCSEIFFLIQY